MSLVGFHQWQPWYAVSRSEWCLRSGLQHSDDVIDLIHFHQSNALVRRKPTHAIYEDLLQLLLDESLVGADSSDGLCPPSLAKMRHRCKHRLSSLLELLPCIQGSKVCRVWDQRMSEVGTSRDKSRSNHSKQIHFLSFFVPPRHFCTISINPLTTRRCYPCEWCEGVSIDHRWDWEYWVP